MVNLVDHCYPVPIVLLEECNIGIVVIEDERLH